eukprot:PRCOL_00005707-RA
MAWRPHLSAAENNGNHIASFSSRANPAPLKASAVTRGFGKFAYPKLARELSEVCDGDEDRLAKRNKALCAALDLLAVPEARVQCIGAGVAEAVAARLSDDEAIGRQRAARCCVYLASDATGCAALLETGALAKLVELLKDKHDDVRDAAYEALLEAAWDAKVRVALASPSSGNIEMLLSQATLEGAERAHKALELLRRTIRGGDDKAVAAVLAAEGVARCTALLGESLPDATREGAASVLALACVPFAAKRAAVTCGAVPPLVAMLEASHRPSMLAAAAGALMSVTVEKPAKEPAIASGAVPALAKLLRTHQSDERLLLNVLQLVSNLAEHDDGREALLEPECLEAIGFIQRNTPSSLLERSAAGALRIIRTKYLGQTGV